MSLSILIAGASFIGLLTYYIWIWSFWIRKGVKGPRGFPFFGVIHEFQDYENPGLLKLGEWTKEYGPIYGITEGVEKTLIVSNPEFVHEVFVKQFDNFYGRKTNPIQGDPNKNKRAHLVSAQGHRWKRLRTLSSPTFSNKNLRKIMSTVEETVVELMRHLDDASAKGKAVDLLDYYQEFTLDIIGRIAMGQTESLMFRNPMLPKVKGIFKDGRKLPFLVSGIFPIAGTMFREFFMRFPSIQPAFDIMSTVEKALNKRLEQRAADEKAGIEPSGEPQDFIDLFLDARANVDFFEEESALGFAKTEIAKVDKQLTFDEIIGQLFVFLLAGYDTTALSLSYSSYLLARHPEIQKKLQEEVDRECPNPEVTFDQISKLKYMECVVKEALRMYPLASIVHNRKCMKETNVLGVQIEKGTNVQVDTWTLHYDPKVWGEDANEFRPERWESGDELFYAKGGYLPFGMGPRICIGMRLAMMEKKMLLTHILKKYTFETSTQTEIPLKLVGSATTAPRSVMLKLTPRHSN
ncbi:Putative cytochrome P450 CYP13A5 [Caenorhabditis elegans]|uniref:Putative cytochrome P450 CYP13A5 n=1 Tax=Caenorhabditis elegans TaxID=6239 RepID=C13A5_CAEEL|nr:Putative cytochrome P450 CYP13A5 [Caenorhabditis elegans]Q27514.1 RecName: Full=Putative cytochrome P450 CYP13A5 [Caenorhabditis elegans]CAA88604.1 Putative cytochrome P450 CYP13A5 [Caenorhabditis elegans]|eukprot:NP_496112.1 Putative cytochrome P450 CYP13A5 [Caenorhabditis elegans]